MWHGSRGQRIGFFHDIRAAAARGLGGQKDETADREGRGLEIAAQGQIGSDIGLAGAAQARQGDVRAPVTLPPTPPETSPRIPCIPLCGRIMKCKVFDKV